MSNTPIRFEGTFTAIVTPFKDDAGKSIDWDGYDKLVAAQLDAKVEGIVPCGTTGESPALDHEEQLELIRRTVKLAKGKAIVLAGTGSNSTRAAIQLSQAAERAGADAVMVVVPYYNKPTQEGLVEHFVAVAASVKVPVVVYNVPGRTSVDLSAASLAKICERSPNVVATKEATGNVLRAQEIVRTIGDRISVLCGDDALTLPMIAVGARGVISVSSNVYPAEVTRATRLALDGKFEEARRAHLALCAVHEVMFVEANPGPAKAALAHRGLIGEVVRGPLAPVSAASRAKVIEVLAAYEARKS
ncbi:4-hydroxy-tetrahydrodipicolinate synthase [Labilithrix luteola]|uniref:4-hydroxy-tetrahydrodipicolinate synthase n=1 Tax=Labilithrix luteola TaxID=1391654 RepID=A0A0K1PR65_9BACT|nr:4-hydroxy-tetrahydrodipicolinate synthase [Labilithrix luteola]AKU96023.1 4-hydroxy-tetrahydrodipicolinate synthase [Labilithrix luteola]